MTIRLMEQGDLSAAEYDRAVHDMLFADDGIERLRNFLEVQEVWDAYEEVIIRRARSQGYTWQEIGDALGITRQAAHARFSKVEDEHMPEQMYRFFDIIKNRYKNVPNPASAGDRWRRKGR